MRTPSATHPVVAAAVQSSSHVRLWDRVDSSTPGFPVLHYLLEFAQMHVHWVGDAIQTAHSLLPLLLLPSISPSIWVFSNKSALRIRSPALHFNFSKSPSNEYSGLTSFRMDWFDLCAVQGTLKSLLQHNWKSSVLWHLAFFMVQLSHHTHDYWKKQSFDYTDFYQQSDVSVF